MIRRTIPGGEFIYPDNYKEGLADYLKFSGQVSGEGIKLTTNAETDGRYHSKWLTMMYPGCFWRGISYAKTA